MFEKLLEILVAAKSGALSGVLIVAGAVVTVTAGGGVTTVTLDEPSPTPSLEAPAAVEPEPLETEEEDPDETADEPRERDGREERLARGPDASCQDGEAARTEARERVASAFVQYRNALDELREQHRSARAVETLTKAETMLREIADKTDLILAELSECGRSHVADRAIAAMETVVNLAKSAATATPKPTEKAKATPKPTQKAKVTEKPKATSKQARTPSCDDKLYANKLKMVAAFERYHTLHDKLYAAIKRSASKATVDAVLANDKVMHTTYDGSKSEILRSGCGGDAGAGAAARAAATFERAYLSSVTAVASEQR